MMDNQLKSVFRFDGYNVESMHFIQNHKFQFDQPIDIDFQLDVNIAINEKHTQATITIHAKIFDDAEKNNFPFTLDVTVSGTFSTDDTMTQKQFRDFCEINGTAALFPFLRSIVADITKAANQPPLILPLINIHSLVEKNTDVSE